MGGGGDDHQTPTSLLVGESGHLSLTQSAPQFLGLATGDTSRGHVGETGTGPRETTTRQISVAATCGYCGKSTAQPPHEPRATFSWDLEAPTSKLAGGQDAAVTRPPRACSWVNQFTVANPEHTPFLGLATGDTTRGHVGETETGPRETTTRRISVAATCGYCGKSTARPLSEPTSRL